MKPEIAALPNFPLDSSRRLGAAFRAAGCGDYHAAASYVHSLPYGRTSDRNDLGLVLEMGRGTCSTKHAVLAALAEEHGRAVSLVLGIYEMNERNTPGVGEVLERHGLACLPEAHCCLRSDGEFVDLTGLAPGAEPILPFLHEEEIRPDQVGTYKAEVHRRFLDRWARERGLEPERLWRVREECIRVLATEGENVVAGEAGRVAQAPEASARLPE